MSLSSAVLDALLASGATAEMIVAAVKADQAAEAVAADAACEAKRAAARERQRRRRERARDPEAEVTACHAVSRDVRVTDAMSRETSVTPLETKVSPTPPSKTQTLVTPPIVPPAESGLGGFCDPRPARAKRQFADELAMASDADFQELWRVATKPMRNRGKSQATVYPEWKIHRLRQSPQRIVAALRRYVTEDEDVKNGLGQPGLQRWLKDRVYEQWLDDAAPGAAVTDERWRMMVQFFQEGTPWPANMGPEPGLIGCRAPPAILAEFGYGLGAVA